MDQLTADCREVTIGGEPELAALVGVPPCASGLVIFAHGSGSGRWSPRNNYVARRLREMGLATLLLDLLWPEEERHRSNVFDIPLLASRLVRATDWAGNFKDTKDLRPTYFGASTGAGAALQAAAGDRRIAAVVSRGGRPDLAGKPAISAVLAPTLLIVGSLDTQVIQLNSAALAELTCPAELVIVPGASHLFEEPGTLGRVVDLAADWFLVHLGKQA